MLVKLFMHDPKNLQHCLPKAFHSLHNLMTSICMDLPKMLHENTCTSYKHANTHTHTYTYTHVHEAITSNEVYNMISVVF